MQSTTFAGGSQVLFEMRVSSVCRFRTAFDRRDSSFSAEAEASFDQTGGTAEGGGVYSGGAFFFCAVFDIGEYNWIRAAAACYRYHPFAGSLVFVRISADVLLSPVRQKHPAAQNTRSIAGIWWTVRDELSFGTELFQSFRYERADTSAERYDADERFV